MYLSGHLARRALSASIPALNCLAFILLILLLTRRGGLSDGSTDGNATGGFGAGPLGGLTVGGRFEGRSAGGVGAIADGSTVSGVAGASGPGVLDGAPPVSDVLNAPTVPRYSKARASPAMTTTIQTIQRTFNPP